MIFLLFFFIYLLLGLFTKFEGFFINCIPFFLSGVSILIFGHNLIQLIVFIVLFTFFNMYGSNLLYIFRCRKHKHKLNEILESWYGYCCTPVNYKFGVVYVLGGYYKAISEKPIKRHAFIQVKYACDDVLIVFEVPDFKKQVSNSL